MNDDPVALEEALNAAAVLGAALARFENALDRLRTACRAEVATGQSARAPQRPAPPVSETKTCARCGRDSNGKQCQ